MIDDQEIDIKSIIFFNLSVIGVLHVYVFCNVSYYIEISYIYLNCTHILLLRNNKLIFSTD